MKAFSKVCGLVLWCTLIPSMAWAWTPFWVGGYCQQTGRSCRSSIGNAGGAGACCDPVSGSVATCIRQDPCVGKVQQKWDVSQFPLSWSFNDNGMTGKAGYVGISLQKLESELKLAWDAWSKPACTSFRHSYKGRSKTVPSSFDKQVTIYLATEAEWAQLGQTLQGALAFSSPRATDQGRLVDGDIVVNPKPPGGGWGVNPVASTKFDLTAALSHEIGHSLGFGHTPDVKDLMYFTIKGQGPKFTGLGADDRDAICSTYPATNACKDTSECSACSACLGNKCTPVNAAVAASCKPCRTEAECGPGGTCVDTAEGARCLQKCLGADSCCPAGHRCGRVNTSNMCVPMSGQCPAVKCTTDAQCGRNGVCRSGACYTNRPFDVRACLKTCRTSNDCNGLTCHAFPNGTRRCLNTCQSDNFCPAGYSCRTVISRRRYCVPDSLDFCPCQSGQDCAQSQICKGGQCQTGKPGQENDPCNDAAPCQTGYRCVALNNGTRCLKDCSNSACPSGQACLNYNIGTKFCVGLPSKESGEECNGITKRCKANLACVQNGTNSRTGICVQRCQLSTECPQGDQCTNSADGVSYCGCRGSGDCSTRNLSCVDKGNGFRLCLCEKPPCDKAVCGNGLCELALGEHCGSCVDDCKCADGQVCQNRVCRASAQCGNGVCDDGETCASCARDCPCPPDSRCSGASCQKAQPCGDGVCDARGGENCSTCVDDCKCPSGQACNAGSCQPISTEKCGDGVCSATGGETCASCASDCGCKGGELCQGGVCKGSSNCGNGTCETDEGENCASCAQDCGCPSGQSCKGATCTTDATSSLTGSCGDGTCSLSEGETCSSCPQDCGCKDRKICTRGACVTADSLCPPASQNLRCASNGTNCTLVCQQVAACGCHTPQTPSFPLPFLLLLGGLFFLRRRREHQDA